MQIGYPGLTNNEVQKRLAEYGKNEIRDQNQFSPLRLIIRQLRKNYILYLLMAAAILSLVAGEPITCIVVTVVIVITVTTSFFQEYRAEMSLAELKKMVTPVTIAVREGIQVEINSADLVPGDTIVIRSGDRIAADCRVLEQYELRVDESILTGESREKVKTAGTETETEENLVFMGCFVVNGRGVVRVLHTGMNTKFGKISKMISQAEKSLPLQIKVNKITTFMVKAAFGTAIITGGLVWLSTASFSKTAFTSTMVLMIAIAVSAFPEGLPVVMMTALATGTSRMAKKNAVVNRMSVVEALGETTVICTDKTGTITKGEMTVKKIITDGKIVDVTGSGYSGRGNFLLNGEEINIATHEQLGELFRCCVLCSTANISIINEKDDYKVLGSATEGALAILAAKAKVYKDDLEFKIISEIPFSSEKKTMFVYGKMNQKHFVYAKGAPEYLIRHCKRMRLGNKTVPLSEKEKEKLEAETLQLSRTAFRTMAFAYSPDPVEDPDYWDHNLIFLGIVGVEDPPREEVCEAIKVCKTSGIDVKMITGDNRETAISIANQIGLNGQVIEGVELDELTDRELQTVVKEITIFSRVRPEHKLRIVKALKSNGEVVTMTGDGVNDAPALKEADIGVAMGKNGTDVSRSVADLTLKDDNFATIVEAIKEGRTIFNNIRKFVTYELSCNYAEMLVLLLGVMLSPLLGWEVPILLSLQILFMNLVTDDLPSITLSLNHSSLDVMLEKPRRNADILNKDLRILLFGTGIFMATLTLSVYYISFNLLGNSAVLARTSALLTLIILEIVNAFNFRSFRYPVLTRSPFKNQYLFGASVLSILATLAIIYTPLNQTFGAAPVGIREWGIAVLFAIGFTATFDLLKHINSRRKIFDFS